MNSHATLLALDNRIVLLRLLAEANTAPHLRVRLSVRVVVVRSVCVLLHLI